MVDQPIEVELRQSKLVVHVDPRRSILEAVHAAGVDALADCRVGTCGMCAVKVVAGIPEHRDAALTAAERERGDVMCICVSRARSERLVLDL